MDEKRKHKRSKRRLTLRYGENDLSRPGFTYDISPGGAFILSDSHPPIGRRVHLQIFLDKESFLLFEAVAVREKQVPAELRQVVRGGFAVRFMGAEELLRERLRAAAPADEAAPIPRPAPASAGLAAAALAGAPPPPPREEGRRNTSGPAAPAPITPAASDALNRLMGSGAGRDRSRPFVVRYRTLDDLRRAHRAELKHGGVFVPTDETVARDTDVRVELHLLFADSRLACEGRVVHFSDAPGAKGLGLVFADAARVLGQLDPYLR